MNLHILLIDTKLTVTVLDDSTTAWEISKLLKVSWTKVSNTTSKRETTTDGQLVDSTIGQQMRVSDLQTISFGRT